MGCEHIIGVWPGCLTWSAGALSSTAARLWVKASIWLVRHQCSEAGTRQKVNEFGYTLLVLLHCGTVALNVKC